MIGAIFYFQGKIWSKKQSYITQISREPSTSIEIKEVEFGKGVKIDD